MNKIIGTLLLILFACQLNAQSFEVLILGIAQDAGRPQLGCEKDCCKNVGRPNHVASIAIATETKFWIIDATPDLPAQYAMARNAFPDREFAGIFLTHAHIGHYTGLMYLGKESMNAQNTPVYCMPRMATFLESNGPWSQLVSNKNIDIVSITSNVSIPLSSTVSITPTSVPHRDEYSETVGFLVASQEKKGIYIPDIDKWDRWSESIAGYVKMLDFALLDGTFYDGEEIPNREMSEIPHPFIQESMSHFEQLSESDKKKIHFIHFNHTNPVIADGPEYDLVKKNGYQIARTGMKL
ncbi:MAG TPA: pyrroloquinoline quinone biosynthesis protein PqqB [Flavobacteriales bacterium]|jgi:pyrroloquinoline quinone biosynthesis protein B|nr:MBL fold metallo-hydrolase [Flavobacteriales bacterium]HAW20562.1 pyrroloquinoline quinone biosynthesis protein PqqB [Flavobacteriales bacterium]